jgi:hypothetical protein
MSHIFPQFEREREAGGLRVAREEKARYRVLYSNLSKCNRLMCRFCAQHVGAARPKIANKLNKIE